MQSMRPHWLTDTQLNGFDHSLNSAKTNACHKLVKENLWLTDNVFEDWFNVNFSYEQAYAKELGDQDCNVDISLYEWTSKMKISF